MADQTYESLRASYANRSYARSMRAREQRLEQLEELLRAAFVQYEAGVITELGVYELCISHAQFAKRTAEQEAARRG